MTQFSEEQIREDLKQISNFQDKNIILSWKRKMKKMTTLIESLTPIQDKILALLEEKQPITDEIEVLRLEMVKSCIHPIDLLQHKGNYIECKFCNAKIVLNRQINPL